MTQILPTNTFTTAKWIVSATASDGTHTTIAAALTSASSGDTIFIRPGTYTENLTLKAGVNLTAFGSDASLNGTGKVIISGTCTMTTAGSVTISSIQLQTNSAALLAVTGSAASIVNLENCYLNCSNNNGITFSSSSGSAAINITNCTGNLGTTGINIFSMSSSGGMTIVDSIFFNSGGSTTANTVSAGIINSLSSQFSNPVTFSGTGAGTWSNTFIFTSTQNVTALTLGGGTQAFIHCIFDSGSASAISISTTASIIGCTVTSSNTNAITGAGTINYSGTNFGGTSTTINTTTQTTSGTLQGSKNTAPTAGFIGERISSAIASGSAITVNSSTFTNITSISLTAGVWDITGIIAFNGTITGTTYSANLSTTSASGGTAGDSTFATPTSPTAASDTSICVPAWRQVFSSTTTVYLVAAGVYTVGTLKGYGRLSAVRVG